MNCRYLSILLAAALALALSGCASKNDGNGPAHDHDAFAELLDEACHHMEAGPFVEVVAAADRDDAAQAIAAAHHVHRVVLPAGDAPRTGWVVITPVVSGEVAFFLGSDVPVTVHLGEDAIATTSGPVDACAPQVAAGSMVDLEVGTEYLLEIGPTDVEKVDIFVAEHDDHGHDHA